MRKPGQLTLQDQRMRSGRGGPRRGAGRPRTYKSRVAHRERERVPSHCPVHVTIRLRPNVPTLRNRRFVAEFQRTLAPACEQGEFRVVHYSLQKGHAHLIVEAKGKEALARGMKSVGARLARAVNRVFHRKGPVFAERFHSHVLRTPREVRQAVAYVLLNARKHWKQRKRTAPPAQLDEASSARWFEGWKSRWTHVARRAREGPREVAAAHTWLLTVGWRRYGLIDLDEAPGS